MFNSSGQFEKMAAWLAQLSNLSRTSKLQLEDSILQTKLRLSEVFMDIRQDPIAGLLRESGGYEETLKSSHKLIFLSYSTVDPSLDLLRSARAARVRYTFLANTIGDRARSPW